MKIGFTGTQDGMSPAQILYMSGVVSSRELIEEAHHGDCVGADEQFHSILLRACSLLKGDARITVVLHPPLVEDKRAFCALRPWDVKREPREYLLRNKDIVFEIEATGILYAAPKQQEEVLRSGTWSTVRFARRLGREIQIVFPDGSMVREPAREPRSKKRSR